MFCDSMCYVFYWLKCQFTGKIKMRNKIFSMFSCGGDAAVCGA